MKMELALLGGAVLAIGGYLFATSRADKAAAAQVNPQAQEGARTTQPGQIPAQNSMGFMLGAGLGMLTQQLIEGN